MYCFDNLDKYTEPVVKTCVVLFCPSKTCGTATQECHNASKITSKPKIGFPFASRRDSFRKQDLILWMSRRVVFAAESLDVKPPGERIFSMVRDKQTGGLVAGFHIIEGVVSVSLFMLWFLVRINAVCHFLWHFIFLRKDKKVRQTLLAHQVCHLQWECSCRQDQMTAVCDAACEHTSVVFDRQNLVLFQPANPWLESGRKNYTFVLLVTTKALPSFMAA